MTQEVKSKELSFTQVKKGAKEAHKKDRYQLNDTTHITHYRVFPYTMLTEMFQDIQKVLPNKDDELQLVDKQLEGLLMLHLIKKFTSLGKSLNSTTLNGQIQELNWLIDNQDYGKSLYDIIANDIFLPEEIKKVFDMLFESLANTEMVKRLTEQSLLQLSELNIENKEILQNFNINKVN